MCFFCVLQRELGHYYGYVYFRQVRDKSLKRGYFQKVSEKFFVRLILDLVHVSTVWSQPYNNNIILGVGVGAWYGGVVGSAQGSSQYK